MGFLKEFADELKSNLSAPVVPIEQGFLSHHIITYKTNTVLVNAKDVKLETVIESIGKAFEDEMMNPAFFHA